MKHKSPYVWLVTAALVLSFAEAGIAQVGLQQMPSFPNGSFSSGATGPHQPNAAAEMRSSGLILVPQDFTKLTLAPGFLMQVRVLDDPDFAGSFRVDQQGDITLPILGTMHVAGETVSAARLQIQKKLLDDQILKNPDVNLSVLEYTASEVTIVGEVVNPGKYPLLAARTLVDVLALAGGTTLTAGNEVQITRGSANATPTPQATMVHYSRATDPDAVKQAIVNPGDTVLVKRAGIVYVLGAVARPGGYVMQEEGTLNVLQAIALANGTALAANTREIHVLRRDDNGAVVDIALSLQKLTRGKIADVQLHPSDVLYVPMDRIKATLTNGASILAAATSASIYAFGVH